MRLILYTVTLIDTQNTNYRKERQLVQARMHTHTHKHLCERNDMTVLWTHGVHADNLRQIGQIY